MESWRIKSNLNDNTNRASTTSQVVCATVIKSPKGCEDFYLFSKGETQKVIDTFGYPSKNYPSIQDALDVVAKSDLYIASPYKNGKYGGVFITPNGTVPFVNGVSSKEISDFSEIESASKVGSGNSVETTFIATLPNYENYINNSIGITVNGVALEISSTDESVEVITDTDKTFTSASYDRSNGKLTLTFVVAPEGDIVATYKTDMSSTLFVLFDRDCQKDDLKVKVVTNKYVDTAFDIHVSRYNPIKDEYVELLNSPFTVGLTENSKDSEGNNIYIENIFNDNQLLFTPYVNHDTFDSFTSDTTYVELNGGDRGAEISGSDLANVYDALMDTETYNVKIVFDATSSDEVISKFETLRESYQKRCRFMYCSPNTSVENILADPAIAHRNVNNRGLYCYVLTWGIHKDVYNGNNFLCSNMGLIVGKMVDILNNGYGEPMWLDQNGIGGQLGSSITKLSYNANQSQLEKLADNFVNAVINSKTYGVFIENASTRHTNLSVLSDIGISSLVDTILELIEKNVLPKRIGKLIDDTAYTDVRSGCNSILSAYANALEDYYVLCDNTNNTAEMRNQETLVVEVAIVPKKYSKKIILSLSLYKSGVDVEEAVTSL